MACSRNILCRKKQGSTRLKGISEVIASILMVMVTIMLVFFTNSFFTEFAQKAGNTADNVLVQNQMMGQKIIIPTAYGCGAYLCFEVKSLGTNDFAIPMEGSGYYLDGVPRKLYPWDGDLGLNCIDNPVLEPGQSCFGRIEGECHDGRSIKIVQAWGVTTYIIVSNCR